MQLSFPPLISGNGCLALKKCKSAQHAAMNGADVSVFSALDCYGAKNKKKEKVYITPSPMGGGIHNPPIYETVYITP